jgi:hypothetical protein
MGKSEIGFNKPKKVTEPVSSTYMKKTKKLICSANKSSHYKNKNIQIVKQP